MHAGPDAPAHIVSEGQGYGMVIVALMAGHDPAAQERFDGLARYALDHPSSVDERLVGWAQDARCRDVEGGDSATDGDLDAAYGLLLAHAQWGSGGAIDYLGAARRMLDGRPRRGRAPAHGPDDARRLDRRPSNRGTGARRARRTGCSATSAPSPRPPATRAGTRCARRTSAADPARCRGRTGLLPDFVRTDGRARPAGPGFLESKRRRALLVERVPHAVADRAPTPR